MNDEERFIPVRAVALSQAVCVPLVWHNDADQFYINLC